MHENEVLVLLLGGVVLVFVLRYRRALQRLPAPGLLLVAYLCALIAWFSTVAEHLVLPVFFNYLEHLFYAANGVALFLWCWIGLKLRKAHGSD